MKMGTESDPERGTVQAWKIMQQRGTGTWPLIVRNWQLYILLLPTMLYFVIFQYIPIYGLQIAFKEFNPIRGIWGSAWVGFDQFENFFNSAQFHTVLTNTVQISFYQLVLFPIPIIMALLMNQLVSGRFKRVVQTVTYAPHFISTVVVVGIMYLFLNPRNGIVNLAIQWLGGQAINFFSEPAWFKTLLVWSDLWQNVGWGTIIYLAALTGINPELHESALVDGATKFRRIWHIDLPGIAPMIVVLFLLHLGNFMTIGFEKAYLMQNALNASSSEIIQTYVYKIGLLSAQYSYAAAVGLFNNVINFVILVTMNQLAKRVQETSIW